MVCSCGHILDAAVGLAHQSFFGSTEYLLPAKTIADDQKDVFGLDGSRAAAKAGLAGGQCQYDQKQGEGTKPRVHHNESCARRDGLKLLQKPEIILVEEPDVVDPIPDHGDAFDPKAKGPARPDLRIIPDSLEHFRMHHAATGNFQPSLPIFFTSGLEKSTSKLGSV